MLRFVHSQQTHTGVDLLGHAQSVCVFRAEAAGRAARLVNSHRETSALAFFVAVIQAWDGHERDRMWDV